VPDERSALETEIARLQGENATANAYNAQWPKAHLTAGAQILDQEAHGL
jgi:hypothetical protein